MQRKEAQAAAFVLRREVSTVGVAGVGGGGLLNWTKAISVLNSNRCPILIGVK